MLAVTHFGGPSSIRSRFKPSRRSRKNRGECIRCHAPALSETARSEAAREGRMQDLKGTTHPAMVGLDGVACTTCHQMLPDNLGTFDSFSGVYYRPRTKNLWSS